MAMPQRRQLSRLQQEDGSHAWRFPRVCSFPPAACDGTPAFLSDNYGFCGSSFDAVSLPFGSCARRRFALSRRLDVVQALRRNTVSSAVPKAERASLQCSNTRPHWPEALGMTIFLTPNRFIPCLPRCSPIVSCALSARACSGGRTPSCSRSTAEALRRRSSIRLGQGVPGERGGCLPLREGTNQRP